MNVVTPKTKRTGRYDAGVMKYKEMGYFDLDYQPKDTDILIKAKTQPAKTAPITKEAPPKHPQPPPDTAKALAQIDKVAQARAALEKENAKMLLGIRGVLTPDQWTKLRAGGDYRELAKIMRKIRVEDLSLVDRADFIIASISAKACWFPVRLAAAIPEWRRVSASPVRPSLASVCADIW